MNKPLIKQDNTCFTHKTTSPKIGQFELKLLEFLVHAITTC